MKKTITALAASLLGVSAFAAPPVQLKQAIDRGEISLVKEFKATAHINGFVIKSSGQYDMVFSTPDGVLIIGDLIDAQGASLRDKLSEEHFPKKDLAAVYKQLSSLDKSRLAIQGNQKSKPTIYIFADMNCGFCKVMHKAIDPYIAKYPDLSVAWVPVGFLAPTSAAKAAYVLEAKDKAKAIDEMMAKNPDAGFVAKDASKQKAEANRKLMSDMGYGGTPSGVFLDASGKAVELNGMLSLTELAAMFGKPKIANTDPSLAQFDR